MKRYFYLSYFLLSLILSSCRFKIKLKPRYYSNQELIDYCQKNEYAFDAILTFKDSTNYVQQKDVGISMIGFINLYSKENKLLKATDGDNCEYKILSYIKDSITTLREINDSNISLNSVLSKCNLIRLTEQKDILNTKDYKVLIGWSIGVNSRFKLSKHRLKDLNAKIKKLDGDFYLIGMNMDVIP